MCTRVPCVANAGRAARACDMAVSSKRMSHSLDLHVRSVLQYTRSCACSVSLSIWQLSMAVSNLCPQRYTSAYLTRSSHLPRYVHAAQLAGALAGHMPSCCLPWTHSATHHVTTILVTCSCLCLCLNKFVFICMTACCADTTRRMPIMNHAKSVSSVFSTATAPRPHCQKLSPFRLSETVLTSVNSSAVISQDLFNVVS